MMPIPRLLAFLSVLAAIASSGTAYAYHIANPFVSPYFPSMQVPGMWLPPVRSYHTVPSMYYVTPQRAYPYIAPHTYPYRGSSYYYGDRCRSYDAYDDDDSSCDYYYYDDYYDDRRYDNDDSFHDDDESSFDDDNDSLNSGKWTYDDDLDDDFYENDEDKPGGR